MRSLIVTALLVYATSVAAAIINGFSIEDPLVPLDEIMSGGPPKDGIPAIMDPRVVDSGHADFLEDDDRVLGLSLNGLARAYPIMILNYHEIVNDHLGESVIVTFCPLCGTGIAFSGSVDGEDLTFGVSGLLYNSDVLMYDHRTESLWSQIAAQAISGEKKGATLERLPITHTTWGDWRQRYPNTTVLSMDTGYSRNYYRDPYRGYAASEGIAFPVSHRDDRLPPKDLVIGLEIDGMFKAYPLSRLPEGVSRLQDSFAGQAVTVEYDLENVTGRVIGANGEEIPTFLAFWFAWIAFHPDSAVFAD